MELILIWPVIIVVLFILIGGLRIVDQYERGVVLTLWKTRSQRILQYSWIVEIERIRLLELLLNFNTSLLKFLRERKY